MLVTTIEQFKVKITTNGLEPVISRWPQCLTIEEECILTLDQSHNNLLLNVYDLRG